MARTNLNKEMESIAQVIRTGKATRKLANVETHVFRMREDSAVNSIMQARDKIRGKKEHDKYRSSPEYKQIGTDPETKKPIANSGQAKMDALYKSPKYVEAEVRGFVQELIAEIAQELLNHPQAKVLSIDPQEMKFGISTHSQNSIDKKSSTAPYDVLKNAKTIASKRVFTRNERYRTLFEGSKNSNAADIGHTLGVVYMRGAIMQNALTSGSGFEGQQEGDAGYEGIDHEFQKELRAHGLNTFTTKMQELFPEFDLGKYIDVKLKDGKLEGIEDIHTDLQGSFENAVLKANIGLDEPYSERQIGKFIDEAWEEAREAIRNYFIEQGVDGATEREGSHSFRANLIGAIISPKVKKTRGTKIKIKKYNPNPKTTAPTKSAKKKGAKVKLQQRDHKTPVSALGFIPTTGAKRQKRRGTREAGGDNLASLVTLINAKLPQVVAQNMGPPGLENRTGRFASSVKVTDVTRTPQGYPSIGYTYRQNPYQVFEPGRGDPRWASTERDPRKLIDASVREIAAQFAMGRFYTRRI